MSQTHVNVTYAGPVPVDNVNLDAHHLPAWANPGAIIRDGAEYPTDEPRHTCACGCSWRGPGGCWNCPPPPPATRWDVCPWHPASPEALDRRPR